MGTITPRSINSSCTHRALGQLDPVSNREAETADWRHERGPGEQNCHESGRAAPVGGLEVGQTGGHREQQRHQRQIARMPREAVHIPRGRRIRERQPGQHQTGQRPPPAPHHQPVASRQHHRNACDRQWSRPQQAHAAGPRSKGAKRPPMHWIEAQRQPEAGRRRTIQDPRERAAANEQQQSRQHQARAGPKRLARRRAGTPGSHDMPRRQTSPHNHHNRRERGGK